MAFMDKYSDFLWLNYLDIPISFMKHLTYFARIHVK